MLRLNVFMEQKLTSIGTFENPASVTGADTQRISWLTIWINTMFCKKWTSLVISLYIFLYACVTYSEFSNLAYSTRFSLIKTIGCNHDRAGYFLVLYLVIKDFCSEVLSHCGVSLSNCKHRPSAVGQLFYYYSCTWVAWWCNGQGVWACDQHFASSNPARGDAA